MTFLNPILAWVGLGAVAIPVLIHLLLRRRRQPVPWAAMRFLLEAYRSQRRRVLLEQWLLLAARCLLVALIALGVGRLVLGGGLGAEGPRILYLVLDDSLTSATGAEDPGNPTGLDRSRARALELLDELDPARGDRAALVLASGSFELTPATPDLDAVARAIEALRPTDARADWSAAGRTLDRAIGAAPEDASAEVALLSDWRAGSLDRERALPALGADGVRIRPIEPGDDPLENAWVAAIEPARRVLLAGGASDPAGASRLRVVVGRAAREDALDASSRTVRVFARAGDEPGEPRWLVASGEVGFAAGETERGVDLTLDLSTVPTNRLRVDRAGSAMLILEAELDDGGSIAGDDRRRAVLRWRERLSVAIVAPPRITPPGSIAEFAPADWIERVLDDPLAAGLSVSRLDPARLGDATLDRVDALVVPDPTLLTDRGIGAIGRALDRGLFLLVSPPTEPAGDAWASWLGRSLGLGGMLTVEERAHEASLGVDPSANPAGPLALLRGEFEDLVRPVAVHRSIALDPADAGRVELRLSDGSPLIVSLLPADDRLAGGATVLLTAIDPAWSTLPTNPIIVPILQELVRQGVGAAQPEGAILAGRAPPARPAESVLMPIEGSDAVIEAGAPGESTRLVRAGLLAVRSLGGARLDTLVVNPDVAASDPRPTDRASVEAVFGAWTGELGWLDDAERTPTAGEGLAARELALWLFAAALALALVECVLARRASHAGVRTAGAASATVAGGAA